MGSYGQNFWRSDPDKFLPPKEMALAATAHAFAQDEIETSRLQAAQQIRAEPDLGRQFEMGMLPPQSTQHAGERRRGEILDHTKANRPF
jgi:hypothetical protein